MKKYRVDMKNGLAYSSSISSHGNVLLHKHKILIDEIGAYIEIKKQKIYLTEDNSAVI